MHATPLCPRSSTGRFDSGMLEQIAARPLRASFAGNPMQPDPSHARQSESPSFPLPRTPHCLADGRTVLIRPIEAADESAEVRFLAGLSEDSRYARFQKWISAPSAGLVHFLLDVDQDRHVALVCTHSDAGAERIVGEGRYVVQADGTTCEFGIVVADDWRKSGVAGLLMLTLIETARTRGLHRMIGLVLHDNRGMLKFSRALGFSVEADPGERETVLIVKDLRAR